MSTGTLSSFSSTSSSEPSGKVSDLQLVRAALRGGHRDGERLGKRLLILPRMLREINRRRGIPMNDQDMDDLSQEVFITVWRKLEQFQGPGSLDPWLYRICQYHFNNYARSRARQAGRGVRSIDSAPTVAADSVGSNLDPRLDRLERALLALPEDAQDAIRLRHVEDISFEELSQETGTKLGTVKGRYYRALHALRGSFGLAQAGSQDTPGELA